MLHLDTLSNDSLFSLTELQVTMADNAIINLLLCVSPREIFSEDKDENGLNYNHPYIGLISYYLTPVVEIQEELKKRNILHDFFDQHPFPDFESNEFTCYPEYEDRIAHLLYCRRAGFLTEAQVLQAIQFIQQQREKSETNLDTTMPTHFDA